MLTETQLKQFDALVRKMKAANRLILSLTNGAKVELKESLAASNTAIQEALDNGNYGDVSIHTAGAKAAAKRIEDFDVRRTTAEEALALHLIALSEEDWMATVVETDDADAETEAS